MRSLFLFAVLSFLLFSCSLEKRHYRSGYAVRWKNSSPAVANNSEKHFNIPQTETPSEFPLSAAAGDENPVNDILPGKKYSLAEVCDTIFLKSGGKILARDIKVTADGLNYKSCEGRNGEKLSLLKNEVDRIHHADGGTDYFYSSEPSGNTTGQQGRNGANGTGNAPPPGYNYGNSQSNPEASRMADKSLILGIISTFAPLFIVCMVLGVIAIRNGRQAQEMMKGGNFNASTYKRARIGTIFGIIGLGLRLLVIALIIAAFVFG